jgi:hypothetical protein
MLTWAAFALIAGFAVLLISFTLATRPHDPERGLWVVFSFMGAVPVAALAALFTAMRVIQDEFRTLRREMDRLRAMIPTTTSSNEPAAEPKSTSFRE